MMKEKLFFKVMEMFLIAVMLIGILPIGFSTNVRAATVHTIPDDSLNTIVNAVNINMGNDNLTSYQWKEVQGKVIRDDYGNHIFSVPIKSTTSDFSYSNVMNLNFSDVMSIGGRKVNATVSIDNISVSKPYWLSGEEEGYLSFMIVYSNSLWFGTDAVIHLYRAEKTTKVTTTFTYADTGETIDAPLYQVLNDIDVCDRAGYEEMWQGNQGYTGDIYTFDSCKLKIDQENMKLEATVPTSGDASYLEAGAIVPISTAVVTQTYSAANASTGMMLYSPYDDRNISAPTKNVQEKIYRNGENVIWKINQKVHTWQADIFSYYTDFIVEDVLPEEVEYVSARMLHNGMDVTDKGILSYDNNFRKVKFAFNPEVLSDDSLYDGGIYTLEINSKAVNKTNKVLNATNKAKTTLNNIEQNTNNTAIQIDYDRISVSVEKIWEDINNIDGIRPDSIQTVLKANGNNVDTYSIAKTEGWKKVVDNLPKYDAGNEIKYTWDEISVKGYTSKSVTSGNHTVITNSYTPKYKIITGIDNGIITGTEQDIPYGENRTITWTPGAGRYIESVKIDGKEIPVTDNYSFTNITADHEVVVTTLPYHKITTEIDHGTISDDIENIKNGENKNVSWVPGTGRYVSKVIINDKVFYEGSAVSGYPTAYDFKDIEKDNDIKVETKLIPNLIITKEADKDVYNVDDVITYTITAEQTIKEAVATNIVIKDKDKTKGLSFDMDTITCSDKTAKITKENGIFTVSLDELAYGNTVKITVKGKVLKEELQSSDIKNIATISSDQTEERESDKNVQINYNVVTAVENGTIDKSVFDLKYGDDKTINYQPDEGYYLDEIKVDGKIVDIETFNKNYDFTSIKDNHLIEVKYAPYYKVTGQIDSGTISDDKTDIKAGENHTVTWTPGSGRYVTKVIINDKVFYEGNQTSGYPTEYEFTDIQRDYEVTVETATIPVETTTTEETTTLEETTTEEQGKIGTPISTYKETTTAGEVVSNAPAPVPEANNVQNYTAPQTGGNAYNIFSIMCLIVLIPSIIIITLTKKNIINKKISNKKQR